MRYVKPQTYIPTTVSPLLVVFLCFEFWCLILGSPDNSCFNFSSSVIYTVLHIRCSIDSSLISRAVFFFINGTLDWPFHNKRHSMFHAFNHDAYCPTLPWKGTGFGCCPTNSYANPPPLIKHVPNTHTCASAYELITHVIWYYMRPISYTCFYFRLYACIYCYI